jgi:bifunctional non-homologous end joining protein LigD
MRNGYAQTIVSPYSVRRQPRAPVSTPLAWDEVSPKLDPASFNLRTMDRRLARTDPWAEFWRRRQSLPKSTA